MSSPVLWGPNGVAICLETLPTTSLSGTVAIINGGTGQSTKSAAMDALSPLSTKGDVLVYGTTNTRLPVGTDGYALVADSAQAIGIKWASIPLPAGMIMPYAGTSAPTGWLSCDGSAISRTTYAALFSAIGTTYGVGDNSTTFNLPNANGVFLRGAGSQTIGSISYSGSQGTTQGDQFQGHYHSINDPQHTHTQNSHNHSAPNSGNFVTFVGSGGTGSISGGTAFLNNTATTTSTTATNQNASTGISVQGETTNGSNGTPRIGSETRPANIVVLYCIKT